MLFCVLIAEGIDHGDAGKRLKSLFVDAIVQPCSIATAAKCASDLWRPT